MRAFECALEIQHEVRLYFSLTQFHILKLQACTSHTQAAQICPLEAQERGRLEGTEYRRVLSTPDRTRQGQPGLLPAVQSHRRQQDSAGQPVLSTHSTSAVNSGQGKCTVG